jgi:hypothetical protein
MFITCYIEKAGVKIFEHSYTPTEDGTGETSKDALKLFQSVFPDYSLQDNEISIRFEMTHRMLPLAG